MADINIRAIKLQDNESIAAIIRQSLAEFGAHRPGTVYYDATTDHLYELFQKPGSIYYVAEQKQEIVGGAGIFPSDGLPANTCEPGKNVPEKKCKRNRIRETVNGYMFRLCCVEWIQNHVPGNYA